MHEGHRDSIISQRKKKVKKQSQTHSHAHGDEHNHPHPDEHDNNHGKTAQSGHNHTDHSNSHHDYPHGHEHDHDDSAYERHDQDTHVHKHENEPFEDRALTHVHEHGHNLYHAHHHTHHPEHISITHKIFRDPVRDWFGAALMGFLIVVGYLQWLPGNLSDGVLVCAAVIGIFPILKNALFDCIAKRTISFELLVGILLLGGLVMGRFLEAALIALFLLIGSFMRLNFSWKD